MFKPSVAGMFPVNCKVEMDASTLSQADCRIIGSILYRHRTVSLRLA